MSSNEISFTTFRGSKSEEIHSATYTQKKPLIGDDVLISVTVSGVCGSDLHFRTADVGAFSFSLSLLVPLNPCSPKEKKKIKKEEDDDLT